MTFNKNLEKSEVREYFNGTGFDRWRKIYSKSEEINTVQKNIRKGPNAKYEDYSITKMCGITNRLNL